MTETTLRRIDEPDMTPADDEAIRHLLRRCFPNDDSAFAVTRHWHGSAPAYSFVALRQGVPCGHVGCVVRTIRAGTEDVRVAGIQNLATAPECRGAGLGSRLMAAAMAEATARGIPFGLLFCVPQLERFYAGLGWHVIHVGTRMDYLDGKNVPIPGKNIAMAKELAGTPFPSGDIHLRGADW